MTKAVDSTGLVKTIRAFEQKASSVMPEALSLAADLVVNKARQTTLFKDSPRGGGALRRSIQRGDVTAAKADIVAGTAVKYARWVHDGTDPYVIRPKDRGRNTRSALRWNAGGVYRFAKKVNHPGLKPRPFLTEALEQSKDQIDGIIKDAIEIAMLESGFIK